MLEVHTMQTNYNVVVECDGELPIDYWEGGEALPGKVQKLLDLLQIEWQELDSNEWIEITLPDIHRVLPHQIE